RATRRGGRTPAGPGGGGRNRPPQRFPGSCYPGCRPRQPCEEGRAGKRTSRSASSSGTPPGGRRLHVLRHPGRVLPGLPDLVGVDSGNGRIGLPRKQLTRWPRWPALAPHVGEPISSDEELSDREFTPADRDHLIHWVLHNFTDFG